MSSPVPPTPTQPINYNSPEYYKSQMQEVKNSKGSWFHGKYLGVDGNGHLKAQTMSPWTSVVHKVLPKKVFRLINNIADSAIATALLKESLEKHELGTRGSKIISRSSEKENIKPDSTPKTKLLDAAKCESMLRKITDDEQRKEMGEKKKALQEQLKEQEKFPKQFETTKKDYRTTVDALNSSVDKYNKLLNEVENNKLEQYNDGLKSFKKNTSDKIDLPTTFDSITLKKPPVTPQKVETNEETQKKQELQQLKKDIQSGKSNQTLNTNTSLLLKEESLDPKGKLFRLLNECDDKQMLTWNASLGGLCLIGKPTKKSLFPKLNFLPSLPRKVNRLLKKLSAIPANQKNLEAIFLKAGLTPKDAAKYSLRALDQARCKEFLTELEAKDQFEKDSEEVKMLEKQISNNVNAFIDKTEELKSCFQNDLETLKQKQTDCEKALNDLQKAVEIAKSAKKKEEANILKQKIMDAPKNILNIGLGVVKNVLNFPANIVNANIPDFDFQADMGSKTSEQVELEKQQKAIEESKKEKEGTIETKTEKKETILTPEVKQEKKETEVKTEEKTTEQVEKKETNNPIQQPEKKKTKNPLGGLFTAPFKILDKAVTGLDKELTKIDEKKIERKKLKAEQKRIKQEKQIEQKKLKEQKIPKEKKIPEQKKL